MAAPNQRAATSATIEFQADGRIAVNELIRQGEQLAIKYDPQRTTGCRGYHDGMPAWDIFASVRFHPAGELFNGTRLQHFNPANAGRIFDPPQPVPPPATCAAAATQPAMWV